MSLLQVEGSIQTLIELGVLSQLQVLNQRKHSTLKEAQHLKKIADQARRKHQEAFQQYDHDRDRLLYTPSGTNNMLEGLALPAELAQGGRLLLHLQLGAFQGEGGLGFSGGW